MDKQSVVWRQMQQQLATGGAAGNNGVAAAGASTTAPCRPSGARWTPTPEQVQILKDLYYDCGIRSPTAEQIQRIAARLRQYGRIEGKNVFYWFQNHKARERQKKRLGVASVDVNASPSTLLAAHSDVLSLSPSSGSSAGLYGSGGCGGRGAAVVHPDSNTTTTTCWGDITMQEYMGGARSTGAGNQIGAATAPTPWPACFVPFSTNQTPTTREPETLPLFPTGQESVDDFHHGGGGYHLQSNSQWWGAAAAAAAATNSSSMTVHHHQLFQQQQQQHSYYSSNQQLMMMPRPSQQDAGTSLELTLRAPYPAGSM